MTTLKTRVRFIDVGSNNKTWEADIPLLDGVLCGDSMLRSIRKSGALMSRIIDVENDGDITVGGWRVVGRWEVVEHAPATTGEGT